MTPRVTFPDPLLALLTILRAEVPDATFGTRLPEDFDHLTRPGLPYVLIRADATFTRYPIVETATVRVTVWHTTAAAAAALAQRVRAVLLSYPGGPDVRSVAQVSGPVPTIDPEGGTPLSTFSVAARLRPTTQE